MYTAKITRHCKPAIALGPTDTRDEASRLARAWIEAHPPARVGAESTPIGAVTGVQIERVADNDE